MIVPLPDYHSQFTFPKQSRKFFYFLTSSPIRESIFFLSFFFFFFFFGFSRAVPMAYGSSQAKESNQSCSCQPTLHSHSNTGSEQVCDLHHSSEQCQILNPLCKTRDRSCVLMDASWVFYH